MHIREYQAWLEAWDKARTWEQMTLSHTLLHALEELGEISKLVQMLEGYRAPKPDDLDGVRRELALELSDLQVMLFKMAYSVASTWKRRCSWASKKPMPASPIPLPAPPIARRIGHATKTISGCRPRNIAPRPLHPLRNRTDVRLGIDIAQMFVYIWDTLENIRSYLFCRLSRLAAATAPGKDRLWFSI